MPQCFSSLCHSNKECDFGSRWQPIELWPLLLFMMYVSGKNDSIWEFIKGQLSLQLLPRVDFSPHHPIKGKANWPQASFLLSSAQKSITAQPELLWLFSQWTHFHLDSLCWSWETRCERASFCVDTSHFQQNWDNIKESYYNERRWISSACVFCFSLQSALLTRLCSSIWRPGQMPGSQQSNGGMLQGTVSAHLLKARASRAKERVTLLEK